MGGASCRAGPWLTDGTELFLTKAMTTVLGDPAPWGSVCVQELGGLRSASTVSKPRRTAALPSVGLGEASLHPCQPVV